MQQYNIKNPQTSLLEDYCLWSTADTIISTYKSYILTVKSVYFVYVAYKKL